jgi:hypothetical protein
MKKLILILLICVSGIANAQFSVYRTDNTLVPSGTIIGFSTTTYAQAAITLKITNTTTAPINVKLKCLSITNATGPNMETCFGPDCYIIAVNQILPTTGSGYVTINNGATDTSAKFHNNDQGAGVFPIDYVFKIYQADVFGSEIGTPFTFTYRFDPNLATIDNATPNLGVALKSTLVSESLEITTENRGDMKLYDLNGKLVFTSHLDSGNHVIDVSNLNSSLYLLTFVNEEGNVFSKKIVKK